MSLPGSFPGFPENLQGPPLPPDHPPAGPLGATDPYRWRLDSEDNGRHVWHYIRDNGNEDDGGNGGGGVYETVWKDDKRGHRERKTTEQMTSEEKYWLGLKTDNPSLPDPEGNPLASASNAFEFYKTLQSPDGHWAGIYDGPMFLISGFIITMYITSTPIPPEWKIETTRYLANMQRKGEEGEDDKGWGIHIESRSTVFGTCLNYVALRLLGLDPNEPMMINARNTLHLLGGATGIPNWGKVWLSVMNLYDWNGMPATPPELWLLPHWLPFHPWRWWIHTRNVYIPIAYLNAKRFKTPLTPFLEGLREEIYTQPYRTIHWPSCRSHIASVDLYIPHTRALDTIFSLLTIWNNTLSPWIPWFRNRGLKKVYELIVMEDENTGYQTIGPVSKAFQLLCRWVEEGEGSEAVEEHRRKLRDFMWMSPKGLMVTGTNGSQLWDTSFIVQALVSTDLASQPQNHSSFLKALSWIDKTQIQSNPKHYNEAYRQSTKGAWPFSTKEQGYTVSDCTGEGVKAVIFAQEHVGFTPNMVSKRRLCDAVDVMLSLQNSDGGWSSYEPIRGPKWVEWLNCAEVFGNIMVEYSYPECSTSVLTALQHFRRVYPDYRADDIATSIGHALPYLHSCQRPDGSFYGSWAICFTNAAMFALEALSLFGETYENSERVRKACDFLLSKQMVDGGWGESYKSCERMEYVHHNDSQVVSTSWAILGLLHAKYPNFESIKRACQLIMGRQLPDGSWKQEAIEGVFNKNCAIAYPNYKFSWTIWALGTAYKAFPEEKWGPLPIKQF